MWGNTISDFGMKAFALNCEKLKNLSTINFGTCKITD